MRKLFALVLGAPMMLGGPAVAGGGGGHGGGHGGHGGHGHSGGMFGDAASARDERDFFVSTELKFRKTHPCPATGSRSWSCPGYVVDYIQPLQQGGADVETNMQWRAVAPGQPGS